jgi:hypothetical protein
MNRRNIYFDAIGLVRAGKGLLAEEVLEKNYPNIPPEDILKAIKIGRTLNELLWTMADKYRANEISEIEIKEKIIEICPELDQVMVSHMIANAMYDSK